MRPSSTRRVITPTLLALAVIATMVQRSAAQPAAAVPDVPALEFEKHTMTNGLELILHVDRKLPVVHVNQWFHVGSKNEKPGRTGFAHLFEHMMFQGSKNVEGEYFTVAEKLGANVREGGVNGTTSNDRTNYFATVPSGSLEALLWLEADRLATLLDVTDQAKLDNQRDVVKNERRQGLENVPYGRAFEILFNQLFPTGHPYSWSVIGSMDDLSAATLDDVKEFFRRYYTPNNLSMTIAGDFDPAEAKALVEKYFGTIPPGPALDRPERWIPTLDSERIVEVADRVPQERTYLAWPAPQYFAPGDASLDMAAGILADGLSSRLDKALVYDTQLCTDVSAFMYSLEIAGVFIVQATARPGASLEEIERIIAEQIAELAKSGPTEAELNRARTKHELQFISGLERIGGFGGKADLLNQYNVFLGEPGMLEEDLARYRALTPDQVRTDVNRWLASSDRVVVRFRPETSSRPEQSTLDRSVQPPAGADRPFTAPTVQTATLDNGLSIFVVERKDLPKTSVTLATRAGAIADPQGKGGLANLAIRTIDMGTTSRGALEIEEVLGDLGTSLSGSAGREAATLSFDVLHRNLSPALAILADVVQHPTFPEAEVARETRRQLDALTQQENNPNAVAARVRNILAFGANHPYGRPAQGLPATVGIITHDDLAAFHRERWKPGSSALIFVGAITLDEARALAQEHVGGWSGGAAPAVKIPPPSPAPGGRIYLVDRQDAAQTVAQQFLPAPARSSEDYYALMMADAVWGGGGFGTRLNLNLREDKGYSYGVFSNLSPYEHAGLWSAGGGVQTDKTAPAVMEFDRELKALAGERPITAAEFDSARQTKMRGYTQQFESYNRIAGQIANLWAQRLPMAELQKEYDETANASHAEALAAAKTYARPEQAILLLVGDRDRIESEVRALNVGDVVVVDSTGTPVSGSSTPSR